MNRFCEWLKTTGETCQPDSGGWCIPCQVFYGGKSPTSTVPFDLDSLLVGHVFEMKSRGLIDRDTYAAITFQVRPDPKALDYCAKILNERRERQQWRNEIGSHACVPDPADADYCKVCNGEILDAIDSGSDSD